MTQYIRDLIKDHKYPACVGLARIGSSLFPWRQQRTECWSDMIGRKYPFHLRLVPNKFIDWDRDGAKMKWLFWIKKNSKKVIKT